MLKLISIIMLFTIASCNKAKLESTKEVIDNQQQVTNPPTTPSIPIPNTTDAYRGGTPTFDGPPSADLEILYNNSSVNTAQVNQQLILRPTLTTLDPDNAGTNDCATYPGIVEVSYRLPDNSWKSVTRTNCENFDLPFQHGTPGRYSIQMRVKSDENEEAFATENILITEPGFTFAENNGFGIRANTLIVNTGTTITFSSNGCDTNQVEWTFADGNKSNGVTTTHSYQTGGHYYVRAFCSYQRDGQTYARESTLTITVNDPNNTTGQIPQCEDPFAGMQNGTGCEYIPTPQCECPRFRLFCNSTNCTNFQSTCN